MIIVKSIATYPLLTILTNVGKKSGDTIGRILRPWQERKVSMLQEK